MTVLPPSPKPTISAGQRIRLTAEARAEGWKFRDVGTRIGTVAAVDGWLIIEWDGIPERHRIPATDIEVMA